MRAMVLNTAGQALLGIERPIPTPGPGEILVKVRACGVCRTDLHVVDGELNGARLPLIPGHEIIGAVTALGDNVKQFAIGDRVGIPWLGWTCGNCNYCQSNRENLCDNGRFTGYTLDGGYAEYATADARFCFRIPESYSDAEAAPLLCAGLIGYRSLTKADKAPKLGIYGFGAAGHIIAQVARFRGQQVYAFTRPNDKRAQQFARELGAVWSGESDASPPDQLDAAIIFAPVGELIPTALAAVRKGGIVVCGGIHMSKIPAFSYDLLWEERSVCSVANLTRQDGNDFFKIAPQVPVRTTVHPFPLSQANEVLDRLRSGKLEGAAVLIP